MKIESNRTIEIGVSDQKRFGRNMPAKSRLAGGVKGHNMNEISFARILLATACLGSPALWARSFTTEVFRR